MTEFIASITDALEYFIYRTGNISPAGQVLSFLTALQGSVDKYFTCGTASSSPITHNLGAVPSAVFLQPVPNPQANWSDGGGRVVGDALPSYGVDSFNSTQIVYTGTGSYYWMAVK